MTGQVGSAVLQPGSGGNTVKSNGSMVVPLSSMVVEAGVLAADGRADIGTVFIAAAAAPLFMLLLDSVLVSGTVVVWVEKQDEWFFDNLNISCQWLLASSWEDFWVRVKGCKGLKTILGQASRSKLSTFEARFFTELAEVSLGAEDGIILISSLRRIRHLLPKLDHHHLAISKVKHSSIGGITTNVFQVISSSRLLDSSGSIPKSSIARTLGSVVKVLSSSACSSL